MTCFILPSFLFVLHTYGMWIVARLLEAHFLQKLLEWPLYTKAYDAVFAQWTLFAYLSEIKSH